jgi:hypothetical protein
VRKCHPHKNQPAREQQIEQIQWLTAKTPRARREEEINKFTHFLGVLGVFAVKIGVELNRRMQGTETFWSDADGSEAILQVQAASPSVAMSAYRASAVPTGLPAHSSTHTAQTRVRKKSKADVHPFAYVRALLVAMSSDEVNLESLLASADSVRKAFVFR